MKIQSVISFLLSSILFLYINTCLAEIPKTETTTQIEINQLLDFIKQSPCTFIRNGKNHTAKDALKHIKKKYHYFEDDIDSAEKFIELSATKSSMSGKKYQIICANKDMISSQQWLLNQLAKIRTQ